MRRFNFGDKSEGDGEENAEGSTPAEGESPASPTSASEAGTASESTAGGEPKSDSWLPAGREDWEHPGDEPAPIGGEHDSARDERAGSGASTESEVPVAGGQASQAQPATDAQATAETQARGAAGGEGNDSEAGTGSGSQESGSRVSVVDEQPPRPAPPDGADEEEYRWHTYRVYPSGRPDAVEFIDTYKAFGRARILRGLNMGLPEGMVSMVLGPSGTGKSVCIKHIVGLLYPDQGDVLVHGESVPNMADDDLFEMRKKFGLLFQDGALFGSMNLYDNVAFPLRQHTEKGEDEIDDIIMRRLNEVGLGSARDKMPNELSGGMRKRAGFARALVLEPDIVMFDEPDSGLDPVRTALLGELILEIHRDMMDEAKEKQKAHLPTFAVVTHDIMSARRVADYINVLWKGRIVEAGPAEDMLNSDNPFIRQFLAGESQGPLTMD
ncbi:MAG: phospholipid/cholesterol/gamma-HCH transport system ATP-binding protein [Solirubrobacteraceae bacterium]|jgi:phospholipid/cholesterol/gamma-HCH transport system ATP-binding protein|nr:phospholipid/cholesterol/gamma-HCH transport system ATP-binding protein [Solirubrobacteraceae bacterium]